MKHLTTLILLVAVVVMAAGSVEAFDGKRKGFILGGGVSLSPYGNVEIPRIDYTHTYQAAGHDIIAGWAFSERVMLVYESAILYWHGDDPFTKILLTGNDCIRLYYYTGTTGKSFFGMFGLGNTVFLSQYCDMSKFGFGMTLGGGYEFARHFQATLSFTAGSATDKYFDSDHSIIMLSITAVAY